MGKKAAATPAKPLLNAQGSGAGTVSVAETTKGDKESVECSEHGVCDRAMGLCKCFYGYTSSDHDSGEGDYRDCGFINNNPKNNPVVVTGG